VEVRDEYVPSRSLPFPLQQFRDSLLVPNIHMDPKARPRVIPYNNVFAA